MIYADTQIGADVCVSTETYKCRYTHINVHTHHAYHALSKVGALA